MTPKLSYGIVYLDVEPVMVSDAILVLLKNVLLIDSAQLHTEQALLVGETLRPYVRTARILFIFLSLEKLC